MHKKENLLQYGIAFDVSFQIYSKSRQISDREYDRE